MAGESTVSSGAIEKRAEDLETKEVAAQAETEKAANDKAAADKAAADKVAADAAAEVARAKEPTKKAPDDPAELRKWNTRVSMELAEVKKGQEALLAAFNKNSKKPVDWKELAKDPAKLEKAVAEREKELLSERENQYNQEKVEMVAEVTRYEDERRYKDTENYPLWSDLKPIMSSLSEPRPDQPNGDPRINFGQHPKLILDELYALAKSIAEKDPLFKKAPEKKPEGSTKTYTQEELDAKVAEAATKAAADSAANLRNENKGAGVGSMGKGSAKGKPGEVDKNVLWDMPLSDLGNAIKKGTEQLHG